MRTLQTWVLTSDQQEQSETKGQADVSKAVGRNIQLQGRLSLFLVRTTSLSDA